jgi:hypothetical protein
MRSQPKKRFPMAHPESTQIKRLESLAERVRRESRAGELVRLDEVWNGTAEEFAALAGSPSAGMVSDLQLIREGADAFLFSNRHMTGAYAESAARAAAGDPQHMIAAAVRSDSATYPRPTPIETFHDRPYVLSREQVTEAFSRMEADAEFADIRPVQASNGNCFLFSLRHMDQAQAQAIAEWLAVQRFKNP